MSLILVVCIPFFASILGFIFSRLRNEWNFLGGLLTLYYAFRLFLAQRGRILAYPLGKIWGLEFKFQADNLSGFIILFISFLGFLSILYSLRYCRKMELERLRSYYLFLLLAIAGANGLLLSSNLFLLLFFWIFLSLVFYGFSGEKGVLIGIVLSIFLISGGVFLLFQQAGNTELIPNSPLNLLPLAFVLITFGVLVKILIIPFRFCWAETKKILPTPVMAFIPASLDKLLGIYLLTRISFYIFDIRSDWPLRNFLMLIGGMLILIGLVKAMRENELFSFLSLHSLTQTGYILLGIGTGTPIGIAGGIFHTVNNTLHQFGLFLTTGSVESWTKEREIERLGGLAKRMPLTFFAFLVSALGISDIPPLNGFFSKWLIYQGVWGLGRGFFIYLLVAVSGNVFTLFSFLRLTRAIFFGEIPKGWEKIREVGFSMWFPGVIIALLSLIFGIFAHSIPLKHLIYPSLPFSLLSPGAVQSVFTGFLLILGLIIGFIIYLRF
uniref:NADH:quinone oxidoreductase/Mrp antiporter transmembrane domain-containing protein n=1 Tax=candidate division WOR-3 bacterium TaxID=2052148 RepID=A0A7C3UY82_UNCW3